MSTTKKLNFFETNEYVKQHGILLLNNQVLLTKPMYVFKKIQTYPTLLHSRVQTQVNNETFKGRFSNRKAKDILNNNLWISGQEKAIANLILPIGTTVNLAQTFGMKLRASKALCHSIVRTSDNAEVVGGISLHDSDYYYHSAKARGFNTNTLNKYASRALDHMPAGVREYTLSPTKEFCLGREECASGIHFFIELNRALNY